MTPLNDARPARHPAEDDIVRLIRAAAVKEGCTSTPLPGVGVYRADRPMPRTPVMYDPCAIIVAQGAKRGYLGEQVLEYNAASYLVSSVPLPMEAEVCEASPEKPFLALKLPIDPVVIGELQFSIDDDSLPGNVMPRGISASPLTEDLIDAARRLLLTFDSPMDCRILGPAILREIFYRVLLSDQGFALMTAARRKSQFHKIARVLMSIHEDCRQSLDAASMARMAGMSKSALHESFKAVTSMPPLQYLKTIRLHQARVMMLTRGLRASETAFSVGYASASQFSREYKRLFGAPPSIDIKNNGARTPDV